MIDQWWSWLLTGITCLGLWLAISPRWRVVGWGLCLANEAIWAAYATTTGQWGFLFGAVIFGIVYARNLHVEAGRGRR